jgi:hypothetical protein
MAAAGRFKAAGLVDLANQAREFAPADGLMFHLSSVDKGGIMLLRLLDLAGARR